MKWKDIISIKAKTWETGRRYVWLNGKHYSHTWTAEKDLPEDQIENLMRALSENGKEFDHIIIENLDPPEHSGTTDK